MSYMDDDENEMDEQMQAMEADLDALRTQYEQSNLEDVLRKIGVYVKDVAIMPLPLPTGVKPMLALRTTVNRAAFTDRVIDPEKDAMNRQFEAMTSNAEDDMFIDRREQIRRNIAEGRDPFDDGDDTDDADDADD